MRAHLGWKTSVRQIIRNAGRITLGIGMAAEMLAGSVGLNVWAEGSESASASTSVTQNSQTGETNSENCAEGLKLSKNAAANGDGTCTVTLEAYVTGKEVVTYQPFDAVVVADCSGSMHEYQYGDEKNRETVMKTAVKSFVDRMASFNEKLPEDKKSRFALVQFSDVGTMENATRTVAGFTEVTAGTKADLLSKVDGMVSQAGMHTRTDAGMTCAKELIDSDTLDRKKIVVLVTDGSPNNSEGFQPSVANAAIEAAKSIKEAGAEVYTICIDPDCKEVQGEALPAYTKIAGDDRTTNPDWDSLLYIWDPDNYDKLTVNTDHSNVIAMTKRFMYLVSSDNPHAADMDTPNASDPADAGKTNADGGGYYSTPEDPEQFLALFDTLAERSGQSDQELGKDAVLRDVLSENFVLADDPQAKAWTCDYTKDGTWKAGKEAENVTVSCSAKDGTVEVTGFDYSANYVTGEGHSDQPDFYGRKLVVSFRIRPVCTFGGNHIPTNQNTSGVYPDGKDGTKPAGLFPVPCVDIPLDFEIGGRDLDVFAEDAVPITDLLTYQNGYVPDGSNNRCVDISYIIQDKNGSTLQALKIPAGKKAGECAFDAPLAAAPKACAVYTIQCRVTPVTEGSVNELMRKKEQSVHYYVPELSLSDTTGTKGEKIDVKTGEGLSFDDLGDHGEGLVWKCQDGKKADKKSAPDLLYQVRALSGVTDTELAADDAAVFSVQVFRKAEDGSAGTRITDSTTFLHSCSREDCDFENRKSVNKDAAFLIHVAESEEAQTESSAGTTSSDSSVQADADAESSSSNSVVISNTVNLPAGASLSASSGTGSTAAGTKTAVSQQSAASSGQGTAASVQAADTKAAGETVAAELSAASAAAATQQSSLQAADSTAAASSVITDRPTTGDDDQSGGMLPVILSAAGIFLLFLLGSMRSAGRRSGT